MGAAIAKAGAERATPLATATLVVAANAPDIDMLAFARGEYYALAVRRGVTHGLPALLVLPAVVAAAILAWDRWVRRRRDPGLEPARAAPVLLLSYVGVATHPVLDWMNTYGMRWWVPIDGAWSYGDALFIIDPWIWLALGGAVFLTVAPRGWGRPAWGALAALCTGLVLVAPVALAVKVLWLAGVGAVVWLSRRGSADPILASGAITATALYILVLVLADGPARAEVASTARAAGLDPEEVMVAPRPGDPFTSEVEVRTVEGFVPGEFRWLRTPHVVLRTDSVIPLVSSPPSLPLDRRDAILRSARRLPDARNYLVWSRLTYARIAPADDGWRVRFADARYDDRGGTGGLAGVEVLVPDP